jgi:hypothetical protein
LIVSYIETQEGPVQVTNLSRKFLDREVCDLCGAIHVAVDSETVLPIGQRSSIFWTWLDMAEALEELRVSGNATLEANESTWSLELKRLPHGKLLLKGRESSITAHLSSKREAPTKVHTATVVECVFMRAACQAGIQFFETLQDKLRVYSDVSSCADYFRERLADYGEAQG